MAKPLRRIASSARAQFLRVRPISGTPYATHLPVLIALAPVLRHRRVLELGSGPFSTPLFLDPEVFPDLEALVSYEDDPGWQSVVMGAVGSDSRLDYRMVPAVNKSVPQDLHEFDLIFIDDSRTPMERSQTIRAVCAQSPRATVLIHDFEQRVYRNAARGFDMRRAISAFTPQVGVCWQVHGNHAAARQLDLEIRRLSARLAVMGNAAPVTDTVAWRRLLLRNH